MHIHFLPRRAGRRTAAVAGAVALVGGFVAIGGPPGSSASSHREAPLIAGDPRADNTDLYAFVSPDATDTVTLIANWIPFEEPNGGPNFYPWADDTRYIIKIDNDGDAVADLEYTWVFDTVIRNEGTFLYNTGPVSSVDDPDLNYYQTYDLTVTAQGGAPVALLGDGDGVHDPTDPIAAPSLVGPGSIPDYAPLVNGATYDLPGGGQSYVGQADDPFFLDLRVFDLLYGGDLSEVGEDTLAGYNVNAIAIQVPKTALAGGGSPGTNPVIGIWTTTERRSARAANGEGDTSSPFVQVSRLGNPLVNEVVFPLALKDAFNSISPEMDATIPAAVDAVTNPILPPLIEAIYGVPAPDGPRHDLEEIFLQGISAANAGLGGDPAAVLPVDLNGHDLNTDQAATLQPSEQLRLNMSVAPSAEPHRLTIFANQFDGFPNGRRLQDDVVDIALQTVMGAAQSGTIVEALAAGDAVDRNDREFRTSFPYLALPHDNSVNQGAERPPRAADFLPVIPDRVLDTRGATGQIGYIGDKPSAGQVVEVKVTGVGTSLVPDDAAGVVVHVTATEADAGSFVTAYNCDDPRPKTSNVNATAGAASAFGNLATVEVSAEGTICLYTLASSHLIVDVNGYIPSTSTITLVDPERLLETRAADGQVGYTGGRPAAGTTIELDVTQVGMNQVPADTQAVFVNVTGVNAEGPGFITVWDCDSARPNTSILNYEIGSVIANMMVAPVGADGSICIYTMSSTDIVVDLFGVIPPDSNYVAAGPERILETREEYGQIGYSGQQPAAGRVIELQVTGVGTTKVPATASAAFLNVTTTNEPPAGFFTVWPCGEAQPNASNGNFRGTGMSTANLVVAKIGASGRVCIFVQQPVDVVVDLVGYFPGVGTA